MQVNRCSFATAVLSTARELLTLLLKLILILPALPIGVPTTVGGETDVTLNSGVRLLPGRLLSWLTFRNVREVVKGTESRV